jgi:hypothetical protein
MEPEAMQVICWQQVFLYPYYINKICGKTFIFNLIIHVPWIMRDSADCVPHLNIDKLSTPKLKSGQQPHSTEI